MKKKRIIIIGGNGFIGRNLAEELVMHSNTEVFSFDLHVPEQCIRGVHYLEGDFFNDETLEQIIRNKDIVIHAISTVNPGNSNQKYMQGYGKDFIQTIKLCEMLIKQNSSMIFLSSGGTVYGEQNVQPIKESFLPTPINHYGNVKLCIENVIRTFNIQLNAKMRIVRIANPYGPGQDYHKGVGFIDAALKKALNGEIIEIWGDGSIIRDYIYIKDVCKIINALIDYDGDEEVFNISTGVGISQKQVIQQLEKLGISTNVIYKEKRSVDVKKIVLDNSKIKEIYKYDILSFEEGIEVYYNYLKNVN